MENHGHNHKNADHSAEMNHDDHGEHNHNGHSHHKQMVQDFKFGFWWVLALTLPIMALSHDSVFYGF